MFELLYPVATPFNALQNQINGLLEDFFTEPAA
jgi:hypothetical protein